MSGAVTSDAATGTGGRLPAVFELFGDLEGKLPWMDLGMRTAPVHRLSNLPHGNLWIKRNDLVSDLYGGNKVSKLEFALGEAVWKGKKRVLTMGSLGTNHGLATTMYCGRIGLPCAILLYDQPVTRYVRRNLLLCHRHGAELIYMKQIFDAGTAFYLTERFKRRDTFFMYAGGTTTLSTLGPLSGAIELARQVESGLLPAPKYVFCPHASNGTLAGLILGFRLAGLDTTVIGVEVGVAKLGPLPLGTPGAVALSMRKTLSMLRRASKLVPDVDLPVPLILGGYLGRGYGHPTREGIAAMKLFAELEGIELEPVYTGKACAALLDFVNCQARSREPVLYWHTYNSVDLDAEAATVDYRELPTELHHVFERELEETC